MQAVSSGGPVAGHESGALQGCLLFLSGSLHPLPTDHAGPSQVCKPGSHTPCPARLVCALDHRIHPALAPSRCDLLA